MFQMKKLFLFFSLFIFAGSLGGCASIMRDSSQAIPIKSNVGKVDIQIADKSGKIYDYRFKRRLSNHPEKY